MACKQISRCRACEESSISHNNVYSFGTVPLAGNFCETKESSANAEKYPLSLVMCDRCGTVQVLHDVDDDVLYSNYNYASSTVAGLNRHFISYSGFLKNEYSGKQITFLEIGCNDGVLLKKLPNEWKKVGVDPSDIALEYADESYDLYNEPFSTEFVDRQRLLGSCDVVSGSNCLAHISNIRDVFQGVWNILKTGGEFWIEVHDLYSTFNDNQWDTIYHEHKIEWDIQALKNSLLPLGFEFISVINLPLHGGLIRARFRKGQANRTLETISENKSQGLQRLKIAYDRRYDSEVVNKLLQKDVRKIAYGASGRANMFLNHLDELRFEYIVDDSIVRIGKYIPTVLTKVMPRELLLSEQYDYCLVTAWNYFEDIIEKNKEFKGVWLKYFGD